MDRRIAIVSITLSLLCGCSKHDAPKANDSPGSSAVTPSDNVMTVPDVSVTDYEPRAAAMLDKMLAAYAAAGDCSSAASAVGNPCDCDKAAAAVMTFTRDNKAELDALRSFELGHAAAKQQFTAKHREKVDALAKSTDSLLVESCRDNKAMQDVLKAIE